MFTSDHPAIDVLQSFFDEMNQWERERAQLFFDRHQLGPDEYLRLRAVKKERLTDIFRQYCEVGDEAERVQGMGSFSPDAPMHEGEVVTGIEEKRNKVIVETTSPQEGGWDYRYELVLVGDAYLLRDCRKRRIIGKDKWSKDML
ncbi:NTF2 fold immunity protein [Bremerella sp.]|uniref:NTF2 fold immunity protein n=1 Tax=Bremerella sp. TaxID=2795602 RepID=UPI00391B1FDA